jgi:hypothetical protein
MNGFKTYATNLVLGATAFAAIGAALVMPGAAHAAPQDEPWPEPPSCSNVTGTCASMEDIVAYECYFESGESPFNFCDDPFAELTTDTDSFAVAEPAPGTTLERSIAVARR